MSWQGKNVLIILDRWCPTHHNRNIGNVLKFLSQKGAIIHIYCHPHQDNVYIKQFLPNAIVHSFRNTMTFLHRMFSFLKLLLTTKIDIILWTYASYDFKENLFLPFCRLFLKIPYVIKSDSYIPEYKPYRNILRRIRQRISLPLFIIFPGRYANLILAETKLVEEKIKRIYKNKNIYYFPNGVFVKKLTELKKTYSYPPVQTPYILFVGRIAKSKGIDLLIESYNLIANKLPDWTLHIVGHIWDNDYAKECQLLVEKYKLKDKIFFHYGIFGEPLFIWYHFAEFLVLPSREEGLPNRVFEAMFFEKPVVSYNVGQVESIITPEVGIVVEPENIKKFAEAMLMLALDEKKRKEMGRKAREIIEKEYNNDIIIPQMLKVCEGFMK
ncbi:MAG: glycosyltransferase family 4 protein [Candidatus Aenigmatarchaeota archaeon]